MMLMASSDRGSRRRTLLIRDRSRRDWRWSHSGYMKREELKAEAASAEAEVLADGKIDGMYVSSIQVHG